MLEAVAVSHPVPKMVNGGVSVRSKVTMQQIADMAGVSKFAVSRALAGKSGVSEQTREYIIKIAGDLGFFQASRKMLANQPFRNPDGKRAETVLILFPNIRFQNVENKFWGDIFDAISQRLQEQGLTILTLTQLSTRDSVAKLLNPDMILGVISVGIVSTQVLLEVQSMKLPLVMIDHMDTALECDSIFMDNYFMMKQLMTKLISRGYERFQFVGQPDYSYSFGERWRAFQDSLSEYHILHTQNRELMQSDTLDEFEGVLSIAVDELPQIFVCANDFVALRVYDALKERGLRIPEDCAVTGFDNTDHADRLYPSLTSIHVPKEGMGSKAVEQLLHRVGHPDEYFSKTLLMGDLVIRDST